MSGAVSGQYGKMTLSGGNLVECAGWDMDRSAPGKAYASCATSGAKQRVPGVKDATGTMTGFYDPTTPIESQINEGSTYTVKLYFSASRYHEVAMYIESIAMAVDIDDGDLVKWTAKWSRDGTLTLNQSD